MKTRADNGELQEIRVALELIRADLNKLANAPDRDRVSFYRPERGTIDVLLNHLLEEVDVGLERGMVHRCGMRETCKAVFTDLLQRSSGLVGSDSVSEEVVNKYRSELEKRRAGAPRTQCARCFGEVSNLFDKHIRVARSMKIYRSDEEARRLIGSIPEDSIIKEVLEPITSRQRLQILKMLSSQARSFSYISEQSGLRGGNLLFHLQRLSETNMIVQQHERGDYLLTEKGYKILRSLSELASSLKEAHDGSTPTPLPSDRMEKRNEIASANVS